FPPARDVDEYWAPTQFPAFTIAIRDMLHQFDFGSRSPVPLNAIRHQALVMFGTEDRLLSARVIAKDAAGIPDALVREIPRAGHVICEEAPEGVLDVTAKFLTLLV
ncbi:MAG: alpha/beta fold hydrolase, partial [Gemmatimonadaceae bacterium]